jgi:hypothetical protein
MLVFFKRLPAGTRKNEIENFIAKAVKGGLFSKSGQVGNISIIERRNPQLNMTDYHGIVSIEPDIVAERVIKKLNRKLFKGKYIEIRRYYLRRGTNDPRKKLNAGKFSDSRRKMERRQEVNSESTSPNFEAIKSFNRKG